MNPNIMSRFIFWSIRKKKRYDVKFVQLGSLTKSLILIMEFIQISLLYFYVSVNLMIKLLIKIINPRILNLQRIKSFVCFHQQKKSDVRIFHLSATNLIIKGEYSFYHIINHFNVPLKSYISRDYIISLER